MVTTTRGGGMRLMIQVSARSTTAVGGADVGLTEPVRQTANVDAGTVTGSESCPFKLPVSAAEERESTSSFGVRPMHELDGPFGWPIVGNFLTYLKKENQGKMHQVQVGAVLL